MLHGRRYCIGSLIFSPLVQAGATTDRENLRDFRTVPGLAASSNSSRSERDDWLPSIWLERTASFWT
jgi:hypothetical protein